MALALQAVRQSYTEVGEAFFQGLGVEQSDEKAVQCWSIAAEQEDPDAAYKLSYMHKVGRGGCERDDGAAAALERTAAEQGHTHAMNSYAERCLSGEGLDAPEPESAVEWWLKASEQGHIQALYQAAAAIEAGRGVEADAARAAGMFQTAAENGASGHHSDCPHPCVSCTGLKKSRARRVYPGVVGAGDAALRRQRGRPGRGGCGGVLAHGRGSRLRQRAAQHGACDRAGHWRLNSRLAAGDRVVGAGRGAGV